MVDSTVGLRISLKGRAEASKGLKETAKDILGIGSAAKKSEHQTDSFLKSMIKYQVGYGIFSALTNSIKRLTEGTVALGVKTASANQQAQVAFTNLLGSAQKANIFINQMKEFAAHTPFQFTDVEKGAQRLMSMGIAANKTIPYLRAIGDAVAGMGGNATQINQITLAIGQITAKGRVMGQELLQLQNAGVPALKILAAQYGVSTGKMQEMITAHQVLASKAIPLLISGMENGTKTTHAFGGMMAAQSKTIGGAWSNLTDNVSQGLAGMVTPWLGTMGSSLDSLQNFLNPQGSFFKKLADDSAHLVSVMPRVTGAIRGLGVSFKAGFLTTAGNGGASGAFRSIGSALRELLPTLAQMRRAARYVGEVLGFVAGHAHSVTWAIRPLVKAYVALKLIQFGVARTTAMVRLAFRGVRIAMDLARGATLLYTGVVKASEVMMAIQAMEAAGVSRSFMELTAVEKIAVVTTKLMTAGQWLFNLAMDANPVGLVVLALVALVAGVYEAYKHFKWFRDIVQDVWKALKAVWEWGKKAGEWLTGGDQGSGTKTKAEAVTASSARFGTPAAAAPKKHAPHHAAPKKPVGARAAGGLVNAGSLYDVNEQNRRERFMPSMPGRVMPVPLSPVGDGGFGGGLVIAELHVHTHIGGRETAETVVKNVKAMVARK